MRRANKEEDRDVARATRAEVTKRRGKAKRSISSYRQ